MKRSLNYYLSEFGIAIDIDVVIFDCCKNNVLHCESSGDRRNITMAVFE